LGNALLRALSAGGNHLQVSLLKGVVGAQGADEVQVVFGVTGEMPGDSVLSRIAHRKRSFVTWRTWRMLVWSGLSKARGEV
jgi:hypothetical protein